MKTKAVILAAGFGTRMGHYTKDLPKPMLPLGGRPMLEHTIKQLKKFGIQEIGINVHYHADKITDYFKTGESLGVKISYVYEETPSGTAGGLRKLQPFMQDADAIMVIYGDIICDLNYQAFLAFHLKHGGMGSVCVHHRKKSNSIVEFNSDGLITQFLERPSEQVLQTYTQGMWVNSAIYCFKSGIFGSIPQGEIVDLPRDVFPQLVSQNQLFAYKIDANRYAIDSEEKYLEAEVNFSKFKF